METVPATVTLEGKAAFYREMADDLRRLARGAGSISVRKACDELANQYDDLARGADEDPRQAVRELKTTH